MIIVQLKIKHCLGRLTKGSIYDMLWIHFIKIMTEEDWVSNIVVDVCAKTFLLESNWGEERKVVCETTEQFMDVLEVVTQTADPELITYADLSIHEKTK